MKKAFYLLILLTFSNYVISQEEITVINGNHFKIVQTTFNDTLQAEFIDIYRADKKIITHTISHFDGDCSSENIELGTYQIKDNTIIFYTYWASGDRMNKNIYPYGFRKQTFEVSNDGMIYEKSIVFYIEDYVDSNIAHKGMEYLNKDPKSASDRELLNDYISKAEELYEANFILGDAKVALEKEVRTLLKNEIESNTGSWKDIYGKNYRK